MYPAYIAVAHGQGEKGAVQSFHYAATAERYHAALYAESKKAVDHCKDMELCPVQVCGPCGYTAEGDAPAKCPICGAAKDQFLAFA